LRVIAIVRLLQGVVVPVRRNRYLAQASTVEDPSAVVVVLNDALAQFSRDIASKLAAAI